MGIKYYKKWLDDENRYQYEERLHSSSDKTMIEITLEEYEYETTMQWEAYLDSLPAEEPSEAFTYEELLERNADLETENAALLFQMLTGEEYFNV